MGPLKVSPFYGSTASQDVHPPAPIQPARPVLKQSACRRFVDTAAGESHYILGSACRLHYCLYR